ncbi:MAG: fibronectin type III domain-containing protein, partial [Thermoplasmatales archaeon]
NGVTYTYDISAVNGAGEGPTAMISATPMTIPSSPENPQINAGDGIVYLTWDAPLDNGGSAITGYNIYRSDIPGIYATVPAGQLSFDDVNVINGITYIYNISANNIMGEGPKILGVKGVPIAVPSAPQNLQSDAGDGYVNLSWEAPSDIGGSAITGYNIYRDDTAGEYDTVSAGQLWYYDDDVTNGATYTYNVAAVNIIGDGADASTSATPMTVPSTPQNLLSIAENGFIVLTWSIPLDDGGSVISVYNIYRDGTGTVFQTVSATQLYFVDHDVSDGVTYNYYVSATNIVGEGSLSNEAGAIAGSGPAVPSNFTVTAGDSYVYLNWDIPASNGGYPITNYTIYRGTSSGDETFFVIPGYFLSASDTTVINNVTYYYRISATNDIAEGTLSNSISAIPQAPVIPVNKPPTLTNPEKEEDAELESLMLWILIAIIVILFVLVLLLATRKMRLALESVTGGIEQVVEEVPAHQIAVTFECPVCNTLVDEDAKSCPGCGTIFAGEEEAPA